MAGQAGSAGSRIDVNGKAATVENLIVAGWTGSNAAALEAHISELEALGVPRPKSTPVFYRVAASLLTQAEAIQVVGDASSGEAEPVLVRAQGQLWLGVGSDHTDRRVETYDITVSKQMCAKPISADFWVLDEVADRWDELTLRSFAHRNGEPVLYQEGSLAAIRPPADLLARYAKEAVFAPNTAMFCGTLAVLGEVGFANAFTVELEDRARGRSIRHSYRVETLPLG